VNPLHTANSQGAHTADSNGMLTLLSPFCPPLSPSFAHPPPLVCFCRRVLSALLSGPLRGGLSKLKHSGFVAAAARLAQLGATPDQYWLNKYMAQLQVGS